MSGYRLIDSGFGRKLERIGPYLVDRQAPSAVWRPALTKRHWNDAQGQHIRSDRSRTIKAPRGGAGKGSGPNSQKAA